jgi:hypothetical protein
MIWHPSAPRAIKVSIKTMVDDVQNIQQYESFKGLFILYSARSAIKLRSHFKVQFLFSPGPLREMPY